MMSFGRSEPSGAERQPSTRVDLLELQARLVVEGPAALPDSLALCKPCSEN